MSGRGLHRSISNDCPRKPRRWVLPHRRLQRGRDEARVSDKNRSAHMQCQNRVSQVRQMEALPHSRPGAYTPPESSIPGSFTKNVRQMESRRLPDSNAVSVPVHRPIFRRASESRFAQEARTTQVADQSAKNSEEDLTDPSAGRQNRQDHSNDSFIAQDLGLWVGPSIDGQRVRVPVHKSRLGVKPTPKEIRTQEDLRCTAGMRNPAAVLDRWPLWTKSLWPLRSILEAAISNLTELRGLAGAAGKNPKRVPPSSETVTSLREQEARALCTPPADAEGAIMQPHRCARPSSNGSLRRATTPTRWSGSRLVLPWALQGPSRLQTFPVRAVAAELEESELPAVWSGNHPSFARTPEGELKPPAMEIIKGTFGMGTAQFSAVGQRQKKHSKLPAIQRHLAHSKVRGEGTVKTQDHSGFKVKLGE